MPDFVDELYALSGRSADDFYTYQEQPESCRYFWEDGVKFIGYTERGKFLAEVRDQFGVAQDLVINYLDHIQNIYDGSASIFLEQSLHRAKTWFTKKTLLALKDVFKYDLFKSMHAANAERLKEPHLVQLFDRFATYNGSNPYRAPGILNVIPWLELGLGTFAPTHGMRSIVDGLYNLAQEQGVKFKFNTEVVEVLTSKKQITGILAKDGKQYNAPIVIMNGDVNKFYKNLHTQNGSQPSSTRLLEPSSSAVVFYWGVNKAFPNLGLHNIFFSQDYRGEFNTIDGGLGTHHDPTVYVNISSKVNSEDAPSGCENWFVMVNASHNVGQSWNEIIDATRTAVQAKLSRMLGIELSSLICTEKIWDPVSIERDTFSHKGSLYGSSSNNRLAAFLRHPNFSRNTKGLYFAGGSVHPGGGIPLALLSAKITAELIEQRE